jgi:anti-sigma regulatory factor (Ser/Thr protein kinase)
VRLQLLRWDLAAYRDVAELLVSELVTNAYRHGRQPAALRMVRCPGGLLVEVSDSGAGMPRLAAAAPDSESGRGLRLVEALADRWGVRTRPGGKAVWFRLADTAGRRRARGVPLPVPRAHPPGDGRTITVGVSACV